MRRWFAGAAGMLVVVVGTLVVADEAIAQLYGSSPFQNEFYELDMQTGTAITTTAVTVPSRTITGINSVTIDPTTGTAYAIVKASGVTGRLLITIDVVTAVGSEIGNLGDNFSSLAFRSDGQLFGVTGDGASVPETLYLIDKSDATKVLATALGNGADGEVIAYNPNDGLFYHWSGNGTIVFESVQSSSPYTVTGIPITGSASGEIFGAVWDECLGQFLVSNIASNFRTWTTSGVASAGFGANPDDIRGMALVGQNTCDVDLVTALVSSPPAPEAGDPVTFTITVINNGPARALTPSVSVTLPAIVTGATSTGCPEDPNGTTTCSLPTLFSGDSAQFVIQGTMAPGSGVLIATAASTSDETTPADNTALLPLDIHSIPMLGTTALALLSLVVAILACAALRRV